jgi:CheY-like chemotaxis protein
MPHAFDEDRFGRLVEDVERLSAHALEHERRLERLVARLERDENSLAAVVRELCVGAREQREMAQELAGRMAGDPLTGSNLTARRARVLIVDDSDDNRELAATLLEASGFQVMTARNGIEGVVVAHYGQPAVVLMDIAMPVLGGIEATRLLKASKATRRSAVIAYTATPISAEGPLGQLFVGVLRKPANPDAVIAMVEQFAASAAGGD